MLRHALISDRHPGTVFKRVGTGLDGSYRIALKREHAGSVAELVPPKGRHARFAHPTTGNEGGFSAGRS